MSNDWVIRELQRMYKEIYFASSVIHSQRFTGKTEENYGNLSLTGRGMNLELPAQDVLVLKLCNNAFLIAYPVPLSINLLMYVLTTFSLPPITKCQQNVR